MTYSRRKLPILQKIRSLHFSKQKIIASLNKENKEQSMRKYGIEDKEKE
jgi:hypothetical protein